MLAEAGLTVTDATGTRFTVAAAVPLCPSLVAVIVAALAATPVTSPVEDTVATAGVPDAQVTDRPESTLPAASFRVVVSCTVAPTSTTAVAGLTVTDATGTGASRARRRATLPLARGRDRHRPDGDTRDQAARRNRADGAVARRPGQRSAAKHVAARVLEGRRELHRAADIHVGGGGADRHRRHRNDRHGDARRAALPFTRRRDHRRPRRHARHQPPRRDRRYRRIRTAP